MKSIASIFILIFSYSLQADSGLSFVDVLKDDAKSIQIKSTLITAQCNNKDYIPIELPKNAKGVIYSVRAVKKSNLKATPNMLLKEVKALADKFEPSKIADYITPKGTNRSFNMYLITGKKNIQSFNNCGYYNYKEKFIDTKSRVAYLSTETIDQKTLYIGIENNTDLKHLSIIVEVVAIVQE